MRKAVVAGVVAGVGALGAAMLDGDLTSTEAIASAGIGLGALAATYAVPNARAKR
jgi:hypothetical protein